MSAWTSDELDKIGTTEELRLRHSEATGHCANQ
jgi:hypothetical protein